MSEGGGDIIIKKIVKGAHGHHGGAWKIAYADFVTAMMAFFLLLWLLSTSSKETLRSIADYFTPTIGLAGGMGIGVQGGTADQKDGTKKDILSSESIVIGAPTKGAIIQTPEEINKELDEIDAKNFTSMENDLYKAIHENPELREFRENILIEQTPEGLRIQLLDDETRPMFYPGTDQLQPYAKDLLRIIAKYIRYLPNYLSIGGHTNSTKGQNTDNWGLSALRSNSTRKFLINDNQIDLEQIARIVGKGDQDPIDKEHPDSPRNMRISLIMLKNSIIPFNKRSTPDGIELDKATP